MKTLYIVSTGPGDPSLLTLKAKEILDEVDIIVGYEKYLDDLAPVIEGKETHHSSMTEEISRCHKAIDFALEDKKVALISNGDINVFGLASLVVELIDERELWEELEIETISGVPSLLEAACKAGAPISQDFAVISLSDRLTPLAQIEKRLKSALECGFIVIIMNPKSRKRLAPYESLLEYLDAYKSHPVIVAQNVSRQSEQIEIKTADELIEDGIENPSVHMSTLLIIGNESTRFTKNKRVLTPRGYLNKYNLDGSRQ